MYKKITRTTAAKKILNSKGRFFTIEWTIKNKGRKINGKMPNKIKTRIIQDKIFGYITIMNNGCKYKRIDTRTIKQLNIDNNKYKVLQRQ